MMSAPSIITKGCSLEFTTRRRVALLNLSQPFDILPSPPQIGSKKRYAPQKSVDYKPPNRYLHNIDPDHISLTRLRNNVETVDNDQSGVDDEVSDSKGEANSAKPGNRTVPLDQYHSDHVQINASAQSQRSSATSSHSAPLKESSADGTAWIIKDILIAKKKVKKKKKKSSNSHRKSKSKHRLHSGRGVKVEVNNDMEKSSNDNLPMETIDSLPIQAFTKPVNFSVQSRKAPISAQQIRSRSQPDPSSKKQAMKVTPVLIQTNRSNSTVESTSFNAFSNLHISITSTPYQPSNIAINNRDSTKKRICKIYLSEKQSANIKELGMEFPCAPPATPLPELSARYDYIPSLNDIRSQRAVKFRLEELCTLAKRKEEKCREEKLRLEKVNYKEQMRKKKKVPTATLR